MYYKLELTMYYRLELTMYYYCLLYDKLWGPSQRVVTLFYSGDILNYYLRRSIFLSNWWAMAPLLISEP